MAEFDLVQWMQGMLDEGRSQLLKRQESLLELDWSKWEQFRRDAFDLASLARRRAYALDNQGDPEEVNELFRLREHEMDEARSRRKAMIESITEKLRVHGLAPDEIDKIVAVFDIPSFESEFSKTKLGDHPSGLIWEQLIFEEAELAVESIWGRAKRIILLNELISGIFTPSIRPPLSSLKFLKLVGRCYISGFNEECIVLCRAVLDTAFRDVVGMEVLEKRKRPDTSRQDGGYGLQDRIEAACPELISDDQRRLAIEVKVRGDKAVHYDPTVTTDALGTIKSALIVLNALCSASRK